MNPYLQKYDNDDDDSPSFNTYTTNTNIAEIASRVVAISLNDDDDDDDDEFEFGLTGNTTPDTFPVYPVFNRDLLRDLGSSDQTTKNVQLKELFDEDDATLSVDLEGVSAETYCLWAPKSPSPSSSPGRCMKSSSTGSGSSATVSKTWRLRNLLRRCKSDGKQGLMLVKEKSSSSSSMSSRPRPQSPQSSPVRKSYLPYKQDLLGFFGSPQTLRKINIPPF